MALLINKNTNILGNLSIPQIYVRLYIVLNFDGKTLEVNTVSYSSKETYLSGGINNGFKVSGIPDYLKFQYDRSVDGIDLLTVAHDKLKNYLSNDIIYNEAVLDPSTHTYQFDNEGMLITQQVTINKFAQDSSILFLIDSSII